MRRFTDKERAERVALLRTWGEAGQTMADCARRLGVTQPAVQHFVKKHGPHGVFKTRARTKPTETPEHIKAKAEKIRELVAEGQPLSTIRSLTNLSTQALLKFMRRHGIPISKQLRAGQKNKFKNRDFMTEQEWQKGDPSTLTPEQLERARALQIEPARFAWLLACPSETRKVKRNLAEALASALEGGDR